jgi:hypothetical protein
MDDHTETVEDWEIPDPPSDIESLRAEVRALNIYVKTLSKTYAGVWREVVILRKKMQDIGL